MATNMRITRSKGKSDRFSLPTSTRPTRKETTSGKDRGTALDTTSNTNQDQHQQTSIQMPQSPQAKSFRRMGTPAPMLPPGPHRPLTPCMPLPTSSTLGSQQSQLSAPLLKEDRYSSASEEETEADAEVTFINSRNKTNRMFANDSTSKRPMSIPTTTDYTTQGDLNQVSPSPPNLFISNTTDNKFLFTNNFFIPVGSDRPIHQIHVMCDRNSLLTL